MSHFDEDDNPIQFGVHGYQDESDGFTEMLGPCVGIVLSVQYADSPDNQWAQFLNPDTIANLKVGSDDSSKVGKKASYLEATVLLIYNGSDMSIILPHCVITQGKCSSVAGVKGEFYSDWTEDVPNGCSKDELEQFYETGVATDIGSLTGDWVIVDFIGGMLQLPMITRWFPSPYNKRDAAVEEDGKYWRIRRNGTELRIDKNGDFYIAHRQGQFLQFNGKTIMIKHIEGPTFFMREDGSVSLIDKSGNTVVMDDRGIGIKSKSTDLWITNDGIRVSSIGNPVTFSVDSVVWNTKSFKINALNQLRSVLMQDFVGALAAEVGKAAGLAVPQDGGKVGLTKLAEGIASIGKTNTSIFSQVFSTE